jgi:hypothetical protein
VRIVFISNLPISRSDAQAVRLPNLRLEDIRRKIAEIYVDSGQTVNADRGDLAREGLVEAIAFCF